MSKFVFAVFLALLIFPKQAWAITREECFQTTMGNIGCLPYYLSNIINGVFALSGIIAVILITLSGIRLLVSGGDPLKVEKAKKSLTYAVIGFIVILLSFFILRVVSLVTGAECINALGFDNCNK
jgi:hypothetical protein